MLRKKKKEKGFTLVEVIVVAVIVAILAAVAIPLYIGYVQSSRAQTATNAAGAAASFLAAARQVDENVSAYADLNAGDMWNFTPPDADDEVTWTCPEDMSVAINGNTITVTYEDQTAEFNF
ncbi:MAG: prepilin-type N-terminal cleavage/methylation domain-containing protein [Chitinivibrionales bacterium]|nr:prepilin-type N-terminal cleavage/methylation domain-containing protein [Chitinivibrionales bacterium]MBD3395136.1 prepilin-type N-terminal cleavage/methylation domain-containing protein [Chitinivibrionales bacterium]